MKQFPRWLSRGVARLDYGLVLPLLARLPRWLARPLWILRGCINYAMDWDWRTLSLGHGYVREATQHAMAQLRLLARKKMAIGDKLSLNIIIPLLGAKSLKIAGQVAWVKTFAIFDEYMVGVRFADIRGDARKRLQSLADFLGTRVNPDRKILLKEVKKKANSCVVCQFADKQQQGGTSTLKIRSF